MSIDAVLSVSFTTEPTPIRRVNLIPGAAGIIYLCLVDSVIGLGGGRRFLLTSLPSASSTTLCRCRLKGLLITRWDLAPCTREQQASSSSFPARPCDVCPPRNAHQKDVVVVVTDTDCLSSHPSTFSLSLSLSVSTGIPRPPHPPDISPYYPLSPGTVGQIPHPLGWLVPQ